MPTYEYHCTLCNYHFEAFQKMSDLPLTSCPKCAGPIQRMIGAGMGLIFKGSGFYITDYKKSNSSTASTATEHKSEKSAAEKKSADTQSADSAMTEKKPAENKSTDGKSDKAAA